MHKHTYTKYSIKNNLQKNITQEQQGTFSTN